METSTSRQSLNDLRMIYARQEVELSASVSLSGPGMATLHGVLCICPSSQEDGSRGTDWVQLSLTHPTDPDSTLPLITIDPPADDIPWSLDSLAATFGIDPDAPVWELDDNI